MGLQESDPTLQLNNNCLDDLSFVQLEIRECSNFSSVLLSQDYFGYLGGLLCFHTNFRIIRSSFMKNAIDILIGIVLNQQIALSSILTILVVANHEHGVSFHQFVWPSVPSVSILEFSEYASFTSLVRIIYVLMSTYLTASSLSCGMRDLCCITWSLFLQRIDSFICGARPQQLRCTDLVAPRLVGSQFHKQGSNPSPLHCKVDS